MYENLRQIFFAVANKDFQSIRVATANKNSVKFIRSKLDDLDLRALFYPVQYAGLSRSRVSWKAFRREVYRGSKCFPTAHELQPPSSPQLDNFFSSDFIGRDMASAMAFTLIEKGNVMICWIYRLKITWNVRTELTFHQCSDSGAARRVNTRMRGTEMHCCTA